ncbi:MAG: DUF1801 domain-containing protein [archaeon]
MKIAKNVDSYIKLYPKNIQKILKTLRRTIKSTAPKAEETISYGIPCYNYLGALVYFAAYKTHIGFYPTSSGVKNFKKELSNYETSKGTIKFHLDTPLPFKLIEKIVRFRVKENTFRVSKKV